MRGGEGVTMKLRSMANGMTTGTIGTTAEKDKTCTQFSVLLEFNIWKLTPADKWDSNNVSGGDVDKHDDQLLEHEHSFCSCEHHTH